MRAVVSEGLRGQQGPGAGTILSPELLALGAGVLGQRDSPKAHHWAHRMPCLPPSRTQSTQLSDIPAEPRPVQSADEALLRNVWNHNSGQEGTHIWAPECGQKEHGMDPVSSVCCCPSQQPHPPRTAPLLSQKGRGQEGIHRGPQAQEPGRATHRQMAAQPCSKHGLLGVMSSPPASERA